MFYLEETKKKPIYFVSTYTRSRWNSVADRADVKYCTYVSTRQPWGGKYSHQTILGCSFEDLTKKMKEHTDNDKITSHNANVYFSKNTAYPRFKIKNTTFKKVLNPEDADYCIFSKETISEWSYKPWRIGSTVYIFNTDTGNFVVARETFDVLGTTNIKEILEKYMEEKSKGNCYYGIEITVPTKGTLAYKGDIVMGNSKTMSLMRDLMEDKISCLIDEVEFDKAVCTQLNTIGMAEIKNIISFLQSSDESTNELGWRTLIGYDLTKIPTTAKFIILLYANKMQHKTLYSTGMEATLKTLGIDKGWVRDSYYISASSINYKIKDFPVPPEEMGLVRMVLLPFVKRYIEGGESDIQYTLEHINLSIEYDYSFSDFPEDSE